MTCGSDSMSASGNDKMIVLLILLLLAACAGAVTVILFRRKRKKDVPEKEQRKDVLPGAYSAVAEGIKKEASWFDGLYESLYQANENTDVFSTDAYEEWCDRMEQAEDETLRAVFGRYFRKSDIADEAAGRRQFLRLLQCVEAAGIRRHSQNGLRCTADETVREAYICIDGQKPKIGFEGTILKSAWMLDGKVIEYGMLIPEPSNETSEGEKKNG